MIKQSQLFIHYFTYLFNQQLFNAYVPGTTLHTRDTVKKSDKASDLTGLTILWGKTGNKQINNSQKKLKKIKHWGDRAIKKCNKKHHTASIYLH